MPKMIKLLQAFFITALLVSCTKRTVVDFDTSQYFVIEIISNERFYLSESHVDKSDLEELLPKLVFESGKDKILILGYKWKLAGGLLSLSNALYGSSHEVYFLNEQGIMKEIQFKQRSVIDTLQVNR
ncbi:MAG: hypothetical protein OQK51_12275 [Kangiellaceae bacterium]|nr:hypothetical protein [Kangiellaceae bacterium]